jgi:hypothetical protein
MTKGILRELGQLRPANTTAASLVSPATRQRAIVTSIHVCNTTASSADFRIFIDEDGTTYDQTTALYYDVNVPANSTVLIDDIVLPVPSTGNLAVRTDTNSAFTFTAYGYLEAVNE